MTDRPIIFSAPMVRALLDGRKTQTRRLARSATADQFDEVSGLMDRAPTIWTRVAPGDRLWVRENFSGPYWLREIPPKEWPTNGRVPAIWYWADGNPAEGDWTKPKPSLHLPRWASRLTLTVTEVRRQRLRDIGDDDALAEGIRRWEVERGPEPAFVYFDSLTQGNGWPSPTEAFRQLWQSLHGDGSWDANPEVVALTFTVARQNIDAKPERCPTCGEPVASIFDHVDQECAA